MKILYLPLLIILISIPTYSQEKMRIAIMDFEARDINKSEAIKTSELIRNEIINSDNFIVIERAQMDKILKEQGLQQTGCTDISCAVEIGKVLSARKILVGTIMKMDDNIIITGRIVDVEKGIAEYSEKQIIESRKDIYSGIEIFTRKLTERIYSQSVGRPIVTDNLSRKNSSKKDRSLAGIFSLTGIGLTAFTLSAGYYFDTRIKSANEDYNAMIPLYNNATDSITATSYHNKMEDKKDEAKRYELYRNVALGFGIAATLTSLYFIYEYFSSAPAIDESINEKNYSFMPLLYSDINQNNRIDNYRGFSFGACAVIKF